MKLRAHNFVWEPAFPQTLHACYVSMWIVPVSYYLWSSLLKYSNVLLNFLLMLNDLVLFGFRS